LGRFTAAFPYVVLSFYPVAWAGLFLWSWRALAHGATGRAFVLSGVPVILSLAGAAWFLQWGREDRKNDEARLERIRHEVQAANPLAWTIMRSGGPFEFPGAPLLPTDEVISEISKATNINGAAGEHGTPLAIALRYLGSKSAGRSRDDRLRVVRALLARGAIVDPSERRILLYANLLKDATFDGPATAASENPLVTRIRNREVQSRDPFALLDDEVAMLNVPTRRYGTPLWAALSAMDGALAAHLVEAGARLSADEAGDPAGAQALNECFQGRPDLWSKYYH
jgi:hypothetical protein